MSNWQTETEEQWRLQVAKAEAWDEGYAAAIADLRIATRLITPNPYERMETPLRFIVNEGDRPVKTPRSVIQEVVTYD